MTTVCIALTAVGLVYIIKSPQRFYDKINGQRF